MTTPKPLSQLLKARLAVDLKFAATDAQSPWNLNPSDCQYIGFLHENRRLQPIHEKLIALVEAAVEMRSGNGFVGEYTREQGDIFDEALTELRQLLEGEG